MVDRQNFGLRVQTMTRSEYINSKHIPNSTPLFTLPPDPKHFKPSETPLPFETSNSTNPLASVRMSSVSGRGSVNQTYDALVRENQELKQRLEEIHQDLYNSNQKNCELEAGYTEVIRTNKILEEELNKLRLIRLKLESELEETKRLSKPEGHSSSPTKVDQLLAERNLLEAELQKSAEELERRKQEKIRIVSEYELKMTQLQNQLNSLRNEGDREKLRFNTEINRLQTENDILNREISDLTALKHSLVQHVQRLEDQLTRNSATETESRSLQNEIDNINNLLKNKANQIASIEGGLADLTQATEQEAKDLRKALENSRMENGVAVILFSIEIERLHSILGEKMREIAELKASGARSPSRTKEDSRFNDSGSADNLLELQKKLNDYERKLEGMTRTNRDLQNEADAWKTKYVTLEKAQQIQQGVLQGSKPINEAALRELTERFGEEQAKLMGTVKALKDSNVNYENKMILYMIEIDRLHHIIETVLAETEQWQDRYRKREKEHEAEINSVRSQFEEYHNKRLANQLRDSNARLEIETGSLGAQLKAYRKRNEDLEQLFNSMRNDIHRLKRELFDKNTDIESWKIKYQMLERKYYTDLNAIRREMELKVQASKGGNSQGDAMGGSERTLVEKLLRAQKDRINDLEEITKALQNEMNKARKEGAESASESDKWKIRAEILEKKLQLEGIYVTFSAEDDQPRFVYHRPDLSNSTMFNNLEKEPLAAQIKLYKEWTQDLLNLIAHLQKEIHQYRKEIFDKSIEIESLKNQLKLVEQHHHADIDRMKGEFEYFLKSYKDSPDMIKDFRSWYARPTLKDSQALPAFDPASFSTSSYNNPNTYGDSQSRGRGRPTQDDGVIESGRAVSIDPKEERSNSEAPLRGGPHDLSSSFSPATFNSLGFGPSESSLRNRRPQESAQLYKSAMLGNPGYGYNPNPGDVRRMSRPEAYEMSNKPHRGPETEKRATLPEENFQSGGRSVGGDRLSGGPPLRQSETDRRSGRPEMQPGTRPTVSGTGFGQTPEQMLRGYPQSNPYNNQNTGNRPSNLSESIDMRASLPVAGSARGNRFVDSGTESLKRSYIAPMSDRSGLDHSTQFDSGNGRSPQYDSIKSSGIMRNSFIQDGSDVRPNERSTSEDSRGSLSQRTAQGISLTYLKKLHETEVRFIIVNVELERVCALLKQKEQELENLKDKYHSNEKLHASQIDQMKTKFDDLLKSHVEKQITNASGNWNYEKNAMERQLAAQKDQLTDQEGKIHQLSDDIAKLQQENMRLNANERNLKFELEKAKLGYDTALRQSLTNELTDQNMKFSQERIELENDLRDHKLKSEDLENKALYLMKENDRLAAVIEERDQAIDRLLNENKERAKELQDMHNRVFEIENQKHAEITDLKKKMEEERYNAIQKELARQQNDHNIQLGRVQDELNFHKTKNAEQEDQIRNLSDTVERQAFNLQSKDKDIETLRKRLREAEDSFAQEKEEMREDFDRQLKNRVDAEVKRITDRLGLEKNSAEHDRIILRQRVDELEKELKDTERKLETTSQQLDDANREAENWKLKYEQIISRANLDMKQLQDEYEIKIRNQLRKEIDEMKSNFDRERTMLEDFIKKLKTKGADMEVRQIMLMIELDRQSAIARRQTEALEQSKAKEIELGKRHQDELDQIREQMEHTLRDRLANEADEAAKKAARDREMLEGQIEDLKNRQAQLEDMLKQLNDEKGELAGEKTQAEREKDDLKFKYEEALRNHEEALEDQKSRLHDEYGNHLREVGLAHEREKDGLLEEIDDLKAKVEELENKLPLLALENERLATVLKEKQDQVGELESHLEQLQKDAKAHVEGLTEHFEKTAKEQELKAAQEIGNLQDELQECANQIADRDKHIDELRNELKRVADESAEKEREAEDLKRLVDDLHRDYQNQMREQYQQYEQEKAKEVERVVKEQAKEFEEERQKEEDQFASEKQALIEDFGQQMKKLEEEKEQEKQEETAQLKRAFEEEKANLMNFLDQVNQERDQLIASNDNRLHEIDNLRQDLVALEQEKNAEIGETRKRLEAEMADRLADQEAAFNQEKGELHGHLENFQQRLTEAEHHIQDATDELNRLKALLAEKEQTIEDLKKQMANIEHEKTIEVEELQVQFEHFKKSSVGLGDYEIRYLAEKAALESQILELQEKCNRLEDDKWALEKEVKRLKEAGQGGFSLLEKNKELIAKIKEVDELKKKYEEAMANLEIAPIKTIIQSKTITKDVSKMGDH